MTLNRLCASGLAAVTAACHAVPAGDGDLFVAGGVESMSRAPLVTAKPERGFPRGDRTLYDSTLGWRFPNPRMESMFRSSRWARPARTSPSAGRWAADQDAFALESQRRWAAAEEAGGSATSWSRRRCGARRASPRRHRCGEAGGAQAGVPPGWKRHGRELVGINDGAAALVIASAERAAELEPRPLARYIAGGVAGVDPRVMGVGPMPAARKAPARAGLEPGDLDVVELNEAFASQSVAVIRELGLDPERVNPNGGAIAIGHPLGMSGARLVVSLVHELRRRGGRYGMAMLCVGVGQGQAAIFEAA